MSKLAIHIAAVAAFALVGPVAFAQKAPEKVVIPAKTFYKGQEATQHLAKDRLIGAKVHNKDGQVIGDIEDLILTSDGRVDGVIMGVGGFLGVGEKKIGVRYPALKFETKDGQTSVSLPGGSKEVLAALEPYHYADQRKSMVDRAKEMADKTKGAIKDATQKAGDAAKNAYDKATGKEPEKKQ